MRPRHKENYTQEGVEIIQKILGEKIQNRIIHNENIYKKLGINVTFKRFPGDHNSVTLNHDGKIYYINECVKNFIKKVITEEIKQNII